MAEGRLALQLPSMIIIRGKTEGMPVSAGYSARWSSGAPFRGLNRVCSFCALSERIEHRMEV